MAEIEGHLQGKDHGSISWSALRVRPSTAGGLQQMKVITNAGQLTTCRHLAHQRGIDRREPHCMRVSWLMRNP